jgi:transcriptional antiterminator RfaH
MTTGPRWYVVQTQPHAELRAAQHLARQGFGSYLPRYLKRRRHARRIDIVSKPLFPRYLFVAVDMATQRWRAISSTFGISHLVCNGDEPAAVADQVIAQLRSRENSDGLIQLSTGPRFARGDKIRIADGVFSACLGLYEGMADHERVAVLLDLLGRKVRVTIDGDAVVAA